MKRDIYRPLRITHGNFGYTAQDSYEKKCACVRARIEDLKAKGYGGIVTNVAFENYLEDADEWKLMQEKGVDVTELLSNKLNHPTREMNWFTAYKLVETMFEA